MNRPIYLNYKVFPILINKAAQIQHVELIKNYLHNKNIKLATTAQSIELSK